MTILFWEAQPLQGKPSISNSEASRSPVCDFRPALCPQQASLKTLPAAYAGSGLQPGTTRNPWKDQLAPWYEIIQKLVV